MKIINNQSVLLIDEIKGLINKQTKVYLSSTFFTVNSAQTDPTFSLDTDPSFWSTIFS